MVGKLRQRDIVAVVVGGDEVLFSGRAKMLTEPG